MLAAKDNACFLEINSQPNRLDLNEINCKMAKELGVKIVICSDVHTQESLNFNYIQPGINQARRGWLEAEDV